MSRNGSRRDGIAAGHSEGNQLDAAELTRQPDPTQDIGSSLADYLVAAIRQKRGIIRNTSKVCAQCGARFHPLRSDALFCSPGCKPRGYRERQASQAVKPASADEEDAPLAETDGGGAS